MSSSSDLSTEAPDLGTVATMWQLLSSSSFRWNDDKPENPPPPPPSPPGVWETVARSTSIALPNWTGTCLRSCLAVTVVLYVLNQKHLLPKPLAAIVSKVLFWPTVPLTISKRIGDWYTRIDETVLLGGAPFGFAGIPEQLYEEYGVRGVINMCEEYNGPWKKYKNLGIKQLRLPTVDHFEPTVADLETAVEFIEKYHAQGKKVYVHCRAGHGRSAAVVFAWMIYQDPDANLEQLNRELCLLRNVRKNLWKQTNILAYRDKLQQQQQKGGTAAVKCKMLASGHTDVIKKKKDL